MHIHNALFSPYENPREHHCSVLCLCLVHSIPCSSLFLLPPCASTYPVVVISPLSPSPHLLPPHLNNASPLSLLLARHRQPLFWIRGRVRGVLRGATVSCRQQAGEEDGKVCLARPGSLIAHLGGAGWRLRRSLLSQGQSVCISPASFPSCED